MVEAEEAFLEGETGLTELQDKIEALVKHTLSSLLDDANTDLALLWAQYPDRQVG